MKPVRRVLVEPSDRETVIPLAGFLLTQSPQFLGKYLGPAVVTGCEAGIPAVRAATSVKSL